MIHRTGLHRSTPARKIERIDVLDHERIMAAKKALSGSADLSVYGWGALNQKNSSTCWAHSLTTALFRRRKIQGLNPTLQSPLYFAQCVYARYRAEATPPGTPLTSLIDGGAQLDDADKCAAQWGSIDFQQEEQGGGTDVPATTDADGNSIPVPELTPPNAFVGFGRSFAGEYDIAPNDDAPEMVAAALDAKISTWIGGPVSSALDNLSPGQIEQACSEADAEGGHAREVVGYRTATVNGIARLQFRILNSWGAEWCDGGYSWADQDVISGAWSLLPFEAK